jgi:hypothetical protein
MNDFSDADLMKLYLEKYPDKSIDDAFDALNRLKGQMAVQQRRAAEEGTNPVLTNMGGSGIDLQTRGGMLDQNLEQALKSEVLKENALKRDESRMRTGGGIVKDLKQTETADLNSILGQIEADSKRRNTRGMIKNILGGAALFF